MKMKSFTCEDCGKVFGHRESLLRHKKTHSEFKLTCHICGTQFTRQYKLNQHVNKTHAKPSTSENESTSTKYNDMGVCITEDEALNGNLHQIKFSATDQTKYDPMLFLSSKYDLFRSKLTSVLEEKLSIKWYLTLQVQFSKRKEDHVETVQPHFHGMCHIALKEEDVESSLQESLKKIVTSLLEYQRQGSNWTMDNVMNATLNVCNYQPLTASSYIPLPPKIAAKKAIINIHNDDDEKCFLWSILAALHPVYKNSSRVSQYSKYEDELDFSGIDFPVKVKDVVKFETQNEISVNVFGYEKKTVFPIHLSKFRFERHVNLLLFSKNKKSHYCWIKNLNRLLGKTKNQTFFCYYCLHGYSSLERLNKHKSNCVVHGAQRTEMPKEDDKWLKFSDISKQLKVPFVVYADFECILSKIPPIDVTISNTSKTAEHIPSGYCYKLVGPNDSLTEDQVTYRGPNVVETFVEEMLAIETRLLDKFKNHEPLNMSAEDELKFRSQNLCHICKKDLGFDKVRDHCHITGVFRGAAHNKCNVNYKLKKRIPIFFHNLRGYDSHFIMQCLGKFKNRKISVIPQNHEKYISFSLGHLQFVDSFQFLSTSLEKLVLNLSNEEEDKFHHLKHYITQFHGDDEEKLKLLKRKGVYMYEYMDNIEKFNETYLPPISDFYSSLNDSNISDKDYEHAQNVWQTFGLKTLGQYHDLYMETDVLLLVDVFENFRNICLSAYGLDPAHFFTTPGLAWQAALKMTNVELELLTDPDIHLFIEKGIRGGISSICERYAKANNPYIEGYNSKDPTKYIIYVDANNLYGWSMNQSLPTHDFRWLTNSEINELDIQNIRDDGEEGYILSVDLEYPPNLHDVHNSLPLAPERFKIDAAKLSPYQQNLLKELNMKDSSSIKLVPNLCHKTDYVVHYRNLKLYLSLGMKLMKINQVLTFKQSPWLKSYIDFNTNRRKLAKNNFEKDFYKLMNNGVFGKTMENLRNRVDIKLINNEKTLLKLSAKPNFKSFKIFNDNLASIEVLKEKLILNRPIYVGFSILDISKVLMYDFHYNYIKSKYGHKASLLFTDTDSLCYVVETDDLYKDIERDSHLFDFSDYPKNHFLYNDVNKKVIGKMKDETMSIPIKEFVGLRPKMYSFSYGQCDKRTAKGVTKSVIKSKLKHSSYVTCLFERKDQKEMMTLFQSQKHQMYTLSMHKTTLSPYDDKRYLLEDGIKSLSYGHWRISSK